MLCLFIVKRRIPHRPLQAQCRSRLPLGCPISRPILQYLRELARGALRVVLEGVMREELDALIGVGWGESSPKRNGYRNGFYSRDLVTTSGRIEDVQVPRDREGQFHTQVAGALSPL
jgi:transposase-like protein